MRKFSRLIAKAALFLAVIVTGWSGAAQAKDPPALVGRLGYAEGTVSFHAANQTEWAFAAVNYPVTTGESFWTQPDGRAEIEIGASVVRMDNATELDVLHLDTTIQLQLDQGTLSFRLTEVTPGQMVEIETPHGAISLTQPGTYHIEAGDDTHPTLVATLEGEARFIGPHSYLDIGAGEQATAIGDPATYTMAEAVTTPFDDWALQRDERERPRVATVQYVSPAMTGAQDLDQYGSWQSVPQYGAVWVPTTVPAEWAPYRAGHWAWVEPWGWTWVDNQPWGFAPFHYGRWAEIDNRWAWVPGQLVPHPVYAPALVAFIGGAPGLEIGIGAGGISASIGWLPLAPNEPYYPPYRPSLAYVRNLNYGPVNRAGINAIPRNYFITNNTVNNYANAPAATVVPQQAFVNAQPVQTAALHPAPGQFRNAPVNTSLAGLQPTAEARAAARAETGIRAGQPAAAPGPSAAQQQARTAAIEHAEPGSLNTEGKVAGRPATSGEASPIQNRAAPAVESRPAVAPAPPVHVAERPAAAAPVETGRSAEAAAPRAPAPGPEIKTARPGVPLRQKQLAVALAAKPAAVTHPPAAAPVAQAKPQPASRPAAQPVAFHPAEVAHPQQSAPLHPTPQGWHRQADTKPSEKKDEGER